MAARTKTKVSSKYKTKYRVKNWPVYDFALRERGDLNATRRSTGLEKSADANGERSRAPTSRLGPRTGCTDTNASSGIVSEPSTARPKRQKR